MGFALWLLVIPAPAHAQWRHGGYGGHPGYWGGHHGWYGGHPGYGSSIWMAPRPNYFNRPYYDPTYYGGWRAPYYGSTVTPVYIPQPPPLYVAPMPMVYTQPTAYAAPPMPAPPIPNSTYQVFNTVTVCRMQDARERCDQIVPLDPASASVDHNRLLDIANAMRWGLGYTVVAHFTRRASGAIDVAVTATPAYPGYVPQTVLGSDASPSPTTFQAIDNAFIRLRVQTVR